MKRKRVLDPDAISFEIVDEIPVPDKRGAARLFGANDPNASPGESTLRVESMREDASRAGLDVIKLNGRWTAVRWAVDGNGTQVVAERFCFRLRHDPTAKHRGRKVARLGLTDVDPFEYRCRAGAGEGTLHSGSGACRYHGGNNFGRHFKGVLENSNRLPQTRYDVATALLGLDENGQAYGLLTEFDILDELLLQRQMLNQYLRAECFDEDGLILPVIHSEIIEKAMQWTGEVTKTVERGRRIENQSALTRAHILYLIDALTTLGKRYVPADRLQDYAADLLRSFGLALPGGDALPEPSAEDIGRVVDST